VPDPQAEDTFNRSRLNHALRHQGQHAVLRAFYQRLLALRREIPALAHLSKEHIEAVSFEDARALFVHRWCDEDEICIVFGFGDHDTILTLPIPAGRWGKQLDSLDEQWLGGGSPLPDSIATHEGTTMTLRPGTCALYRRLPS
jgi:maltooligosyltrehalose trehalohydrolase